MHNVPLNIIIAGGKTGGHLFPGIAVAQAIQRRQPDSRILFVGTNHEFETRTLARYGFSHQSIMSAPIKGKNLISKTWSLCIVAVSMIQSAFLIQKFKPHVVLGVGGFSSFAVVFIAWLFRIPTAIQEQNSIPGITNRVLAKFSKIIFTAFQSTKGFNRLSTVMYTGNPVRRMPRPSEATAKDTPSPQKGDTGLTILVTGGSQGAHSINTAVIGALKQLTDTKNLVVIHQTGIADETWAKDQYRSLTVTSETRAFFHDMPLYQDMADLVICRAGAGTLSELALKGLPAILVPFPYAADDHQTFNARAVADAGAAIMIKDDELNPDILAEQITRLQENPDQLAQMAKRSKTLSMPDADETIARELLTLANRRN